MYLSYVPLVTAVVLFVRCDVTSAATKSGWIQNSQIDTMDGVKTTLVEANNSPIKRLLRSVDEDVGDGRRLNNKIPDKVVKKLLAKDDTMEKAFYDWNKAGLTELDVAEALRGDPTRTDRLVSWLRRNGWIGQYERVEKPLKKRSLALLKKYSDYLAGP
ncbi:RxLR effector protein [Phytophthora megakarya]|uniref:RxLR effector protein n=1 Tax=Phytophthora megakarya TaxID=4795 RepID=A0A225WJQ5_9STRA|nr:RxLR effector protein [Phytophthora megakarya]